MQQAERTLQQRHRQLELEHKLKTLNQYEPPETFQGAGYHQQQRKHKRAGQQQQESSSGTSSESDSDSGSSGVLPSSASGLDAGPGAGQGCLAEAAPAAGPSGSERHKTGSEVGFEGGDVSLPSRAPAAGEVQGEPSAAFSAHALPQAAAAARKQKQLAVAAAGAAGAAASRALQAPGTPSQSS